MTPPAPSLKESVPGLRRILHRLSPNLRRQWPLLAGGMVALLFEVALRLLEPWPLKFIIDRVAEPDPSAPSTDSGFADQLDPLTLIAVGSAALVLVTGLRAVSAYLSTIAFALAGNRVLTEVRAQLFRHLQRLSLGWHSRARSGDLITRITGDIGRLQEVAVTAALPLVGNVVTMAGMMAVMLWLDWQLALIALGAFPLFLLTAFRLTREISTVSRRQRTLESGLASSASESFGAMRLVQSYSLEEPLERTFEGRNDKSLKEGVKAKRLAAGLERQTDVFVALASGLVIFFGARAVLRGTLSPGDLVVFALYLRAAFKPMRDMAKYTGRIARAVASGERVIDVLDTEIEVRDRPGAVPAPPLRGQLGFEGVTFAYEPGHDVLRDLSLEVAPGEHVALVGPSGGGKSSLVSLLLRLSDPGFGRVLVDGRDVRDFTLASLRGQTAIVLQDSVLFGISVRENIAHGRLDASQEDIEEAARLANAHDFIERMPEGYDTILGERGATVSGGQRQRIAIARAAVRRAPIVILDEPTTGLDRANELEVSAALERLTAGRTTLLVAHDLDAARGCDRILFIDDGGVAESGAHDELMALGGRYATLYQRQTLSRAFAAEDTGEDARAAAR